MARGLSHEFKRVIAGACALMVVTGSVPMQPVADAFNSLAMAASAENFADGLTNGQILHVGDTFTVEDIYAVGESDSGYYLRSDYGKITLVKGNVVFNGAPDFVESDTGMYYAFKTDNRGVLIDCDDQSQTVRTGKFLFEVTHWSDGESDGLSVTRNGNVVNFAVHETKYLSNLYAKATSATYSGDALTPTLTWYKNVGTSDEAPVTLTEGTDYEITAVYKAKKEDEGSEYVPVGDSIGTSATEAGTYLVDIQGKGNYSGKQRIVWTINPADIAALTGVTTTYNGGPQNLVSGTPTAGTVFSLTEPRADYDTEMQRVGALADQANAASLAYQDQGQTTPASYYYNVSSALINYREAIRYLKENNEFDANYSFDYVLECVNGMESYDVIANDDATLYVQTYLKGKTFEKFKARFTAADPVWKSADEITATDAGTYTVWYKYGGNSANYNDKVNSFTATINQATPSFTTAPAIANNGKLYYSGEEQDLITEGTIGENMGTLQYAAAPNNVIRRNIETPMESVEVGKVYAPDGRGGITLPTKYKKLILTQNGDSKEYSPEKYLGFNLYVFEGKYKLLTSGDTVQFGTNDIGFLITELDEDQKVIYATVVEPSDRNVPDDLEWSTEVPERTDVGTYDVYYRVVSNENSTNYKEVAPTKFGTVEIKYRTVTATLSNLDSDDAQKPKAKIVEVTDNGEKDVQPNGGIYTLTATKTYRIYTQKTIAGTTVQEYLLGSQPLSGSEYKYCYTFNIPAAAEYDSAAFSHENNWKGAVYTDESDKLYIADGEVNKYTGTLAAILKGENTYYYGDTPTENDVEIQDFAKGIVKVKEIYLENAAGTRVDDLNNVAYGEYKLKAEVEIDADGDTDFESGSQTTQTMYKNVTYAPRPVDKCTTETSYIYYMENNEEHKLDVKTDEKTEEKYIEFPAYTYDGTEKTLPEMFIHTPDDAEKVLLVTNEPTAATKTDAGKYSFTAYPVDDTGEMALQKAKNYDGDILIRWQINKAEAKVTVAPKSGIVYDGKQLDINDFEIKAADGDNADALTKEFLATIGAENSGTTASVTPAKVESTTEADYEDSDYTGANGADIDEENADNFSGKIVNGNLGFVKGNADEITVRFEKANSSDENIAVNTININYNASVNCLYSPEDADLNARLSIDDMVYVFAKRGYKLQIEEVLVDGSSDLSSDATTISYTVKVKAIPADAKKTTTGLTDSDLINASKTDEVKKANVVIKSKNFADIEYVQKFDKDDKDKIVEDKSLEVNIAKRKVTVTPEAGQKITYRDTVMPDLKYTYEKAAAESTTGVVAADESLFGTSDDTQQPSNPVLNALNSVPKKIDKVIFDTKPLPVIYVGKFAQSTGEDEAEFVYDKTEEGKTDYSKAVADGIVNNAGKYDYAASKFDNYTVVFPENADKFTVDRLDLNNFEDLNIVLTGDEQKGWAQEGNSGSYTYDGTTKAVEVKRVANGVSETAEFSADALISEDYTAEKSFENNGVNLVSDYGFAAGVGVNYNHFSIYGNKSLTVTAPEGTTIDRIAYTYGYISNPTFNNPNEATIETNTNEKIITVKNVNSNTFTLSLSSGQLAITNVSVEYSSGFALTAGTDYTVGGSVKSATSGEKTVQVKGKGNYTGVAKATWEIISAEVADGQVKFKINDDAKLIELPQDVKYYNWHYTGEPISCGAEFADPDSDYAQEAEVTVKYTRFNDITKEYEEVDEAVHWGKYKVNVKVECDGYNTVEFDHDITISPKEIMISTPYTMNYGEDYLELTDSILAEAVENGLLESDAELIKQLLEDGTLIWYYDRDAELFYPTWSETVLNAAVEEAVNEGKNPEDWTVIDSMIHKLYGDEIYDVCNAHDNDIILDNFTLKSKSIKDKSITVEFTGGSAVVLDEEGFAESNSIVVKDTAILDANGEPTVLTEGTDYELNIESTATAGEFTVEIIGQGNYKNIRKETFNAVTSVEELASVEYTKVEIADIAKKQIRVAVKAEPVFEGYEIVKTGLVLWNSAEGEPSGELTLENAAQYDDIKTGGKAASEYSAKIKDNGAGIKAVGYVTITDGTNTYTVYADEPVETTYDETAMESVSIDYTKVEIADMAKKQIRVAVASEVNTEGFEIVKTGLVLWNSAEGEPSGELTLENAAQYDDIKTGGAAASEYSAKIKDNGAGIKAVGYVTFTDGTNTYTKYCGKIVETNFDQMMNERN